MSKLPSANSRVINHGSNFRHKLLGTLGVALLSVFAVAGCQSSGTSADASAGQAVSCSKCQVTWVKTPTSGPRGNIVGYSTGKKMECPDCKTAVENFFATGKLEHTCKTCGGDMQPCEVH